MPPIVSVTPALHVATSAIWQLTSTFIVHEGNAAIVDPAYFPQELAGLAALPAERGWLLRHVIFTHADWDHIVGWQYFPGASRVGHVGFAEVDAAATLADVAQFDQRYYVDRPQPLTFPALDLPVADAAALPLDDEHLLFLHTPGHVATQLCILLPWDRSAVVGDMLSDREFPFIGLSARAYQQSLARLRQATDRYDLRVVVPGHGRPAASRQEILRRISRDEAYVGTLLLLGEEAIARGWSEEEFVLRGAEAIPYDEVPIAASLFEMHRENLQLTYRELLPR